MGIPSDLDELVPSGITCPDYRRSEGGGRRCRHYADGGGCDLLVHPRCVEWIKGRAPKPSADAEIDLPQVDRSVICAEHAANFASLGVEIEFEQVAEGPGGTLTSYWWLVGKETGQDRPELTADDLRRLEAVWSRFADAKVIAVQRCGGGTP